MAVEDSIEQIGRNPFIGSTRKFENSRIENLRMWTIKDFTDYQIFYTVKEETIEIVRVLHGARDLPNIFN